MSTYKRNEMLNRMEEGSCRGKRAHMSMRAASEAAATTRTRPGDVLNAYRCPFCLLFHVGHPKSKKRLSMERSLGDSNIRGDWNTLTL
jgi:hypothetical protein